MCFDCNEYLYRGMCKNTECEQYSHKELMDYETGEITVNIPIKPEDIPLSWKVPDMPEDWTLTIEVKPGKWKAYTGTYNPETKKWSWTEDE